MGEAHFTYCSLFIPPTLQLQYAFVFSQRMVISGAFHVANSHMHHCSVYSQQY